jgi:hypothetical protein
MTAFLFVALIPVMLMGFALYTVIAVAFFVTVPLIFRELRQRCRQATEPG